RAARVPGHQSGTGVLPDDDHRARLGPELRGPDEHRRCLRAPPAQQGRRSVPEQAHPDRARCRLLPRRGRRRMNSRSLSFRLVTWYAGLLTIVFVLLGSLTFLLVRHYLESNLLDIQARRAHQIADTLVAAIGRTGEAAVANEIESLYSPEANDRFLRVTRDDGHVIYASGAPKDRSFDPADVPGVSLRRSREFNRREQLTSGALLIAAVPQSVGERRYLVEVGVSSARTEATLNDVLFMLAVGLPVAVIVAVAGGFILVRRALVPVDRIARKAEEISQHNLSDRLPVVRTGDELERLSVSLNHMINRLEDAIQTSKRFVA